MRALVSGGGDGRHAMYLRSLSFSCFFLVPKKEELGLGSIAGGFAPCHGMGGCAVWDAKGIK